MPWFDETFFASIAHHYWHHNSFVPEISSTIMQHQPILIYGPLYFKLTSLSFTFFGFGIWQFRIVNFLFGLLAIVLVILIKNKSLGTPLFKKNDVWWCLLLLADPFITLCLHEARMDFMALVFVLLAIYFFMLATDHKRWFYFLFVGICSASAMLTTPRIFFILLVLAILILIRVCKQTLKISALLYMAISFIVMYSSWIYTCGGINAFVNIYVGSLDHVVGGNNMLLNYLWPNFYIPRQQYLLILLVIFLFCWTIFTKRKFLNHFVIYMAVPSIVLFYLLIKDWGQYAVFIIPFYYLIFILLVEQFQTKYMQRFALLMLLFNVFFFALKTVQTSISMKARNPNVASEFVRKHIPANSSVIGDATYYYAVVQNGSRYEYIDKFGTLTQREHLLRTKYRYQYIIVSDIEKSRYQNTFNYFAQKQSLKMIARLAPAPIVEVPLVSQFDTKAYACSIYRVENK